MDSVYRGDTRPPDKVKAGGFKAWVPLTVEQARDFIRLYTGLKQLQDCSFKQLVSRGQIALENNSLTGVKRTPLDLSQLIIRSRNRGPSISTDPTKECGGYAHGYIYQIDCKHLIETAWDKVAPTLRSNPRWPTLWLDAGTLDLANSIAIKSKGDIEEVSFLTSIPPNKIIGSNQVK